MAQISAVANVAANSDAIPARDDTRLRIVTAAIRLLTREGRDAVTTRAVADEAGVQPPAIYRLFTDKSGLLDAVAEHGFAAYLKEKTLRPSTGDPVEDLRAGWDLHIDFGLAQPGIYKLMYGDPQPGVQSPAATSSWRILRQHIHRIAVAGRLRVSEDRAADLVHASGCGIVLTLLATPEVSRDMTIAAIARDAVIGAITTTGAVAETSGPVAAAVTLRANLSKAASLSKAERTLMAEWLDRITSDAQRHS